MVDYPWTPPIGGSKLCGPQNLNCQIQIDWKSDAQNSNQGVPLALSKGHKKHFDFRRFVDHFCPQKKGPNFWNVEFVV